MNVRIQHGWYSRISSDNTDLNSGQPVIFLWNERILREWQAKSEKPAVVIGAPFVMLRRSLGIVQSVSARGTIAFPQHSTTNNESVYDVVKYCQELKSLPEKCKPITICLHYKDPVTHKRAFSDYGFHTVSAGHSRQPNAGFFRRFYQLLSQHRFTTSNDLGSYTFYAVEMGIPFFLHGHSVELRNKESGSPLQRGDTYYSLRELFVGLTDEISHEQREAVMSEIGSNAIPTADVLRKMLYRYLRKDMKSYPARAARLPFQAYRQLRDS